MLLYLNLLFKIINDFKSVNLILSLDGEKPAMNGDYHPDALDEDQNQRNIIKIKGRQENCEAAKQALLVNYLCIYFI